MQIPSAHSKIFANISHLILSKHTSMFPVVSCMLDILKHTPHISKFTFDGNDEFSYENVYLYDIVLAPILYTVNLTAPGSGLDVLRRLDAPSLTDVRLGGWGGSMDFMSIGVRRCLIACMMRSQVCQTGRDIQRVELHAINMREHDHGRLFRDFPDLESLWFVLSDITDETFVGATCHKLTHLDIQQCEHTTVQGVLGFVEGRSIVSEARFELSISGCHKINPDDLRSFLPSVSWTRPSKLPQKRWSYTTVSP